MSQSEEKAGLMGKALYWFMPFLFVALPMFIIIGAPISRIKEKNRKQRQNQEAYSAWKKVTGVTNLTYREWWVLREQKALPYTPNETSGGDKSIVVIPLK